MKLARLENNLAAWTGDAALLLVARMVLVEMYPDMPIKYLQLRQERVVSNFALNRYCERNQLKHGCNIMEIRIGEKIFTSLDELKTMIRDIIKHDHVIRKWDSEQTINGKANPVFLAQAKEKELARMKKKEFFNALKKLRLSYRWQCRLFDWFDKVYNFYQKRIKIPMSQ